MQFESRASSMHMVDGYARFEDTLRSCVGVDPN